MEKAGIVEGYMGLPSYSWFIARRQRFWPISKGDAGVVQRISLVWVPQLHLQSPNCRRHHPASPIAFQTSPRTLFFEESRTTLHV